MNTDKFEDTLKEVLSACRDGELGYERAAAEIGNTEIKTIFNRLAQQRKLFVEELKADARDMGLDVDASGTVKGFFHRNWLDVKSTFASKEDETIIEEAIDGEKSAVETYEKALRCSDVPDYIDTKLRSQKGLIEGAINQLREFEVAVS